MFNKAMHGFVNCFSLINSLYVFHSIRTELKYFDTTKIKYRKVFKLSRAEENGSPILYRKTPEPFF